MFYIFSFLLVQNVFGASNISPRIDPLVETKLGLIRGLRSDDGLYSTFLGIPYAVVDEANPFAPSVPHGGFNDTFNAFDGSVECPQARSEDAPKGQIQCLNVNVYVPVIATSRNPLPVMVYIHGGAFIGGSGGTGMGSPDYLLQKGVLYVSINYRLGIYGFFCTDSPKAPGNIGLKDQLIALRWIRDNIASFGGNPDKVTVFGESAGSMSIHMHLLSHHEKLFHGAIMQSGPATSPLTIVQKDNSLPLRLAGYLGYVTENVDEALDFIAKADVHLAIAAATKLTSPTIYSTEPLTKPCVEKEFEGIERFLTINPNEAKPSKSKLMPVLIGHASQELLFQHGGQPADFFTNYSFKDILSFGFDVEGFDSMINALKQFYIGDEPPSVSLANEITSYASDFCFNHPVERAIQNMVDAGSASVYHYIFSYVGSMGMMGGNNWNISGASHASDMEYVFKMRNADNVTDDDKKMVERMTTMWTNFAKYGVPIPETSELFPVKWEPVTKENEPYLNIDKELTLQYRPFHSRMTYWDLFFMLNADHTLWYKNKN